MTLVNELGSVEAFVKALFPSVVTVKQTVPLQPVAGTFVIRFQNGSTESETAHHFRNSRDYQLVYFGTSAADVLAKMDAVSSALYQTLLIPISGSLRYIRVDQFSMSAPFKTDNDVHAIIGVLSTEVRQARTQQVYDKIAQVYTRYITIP
ncbi:hypothetical protein [Paenibacillus agricola]|uniref:Sensory transduction regulator n=1 Tax=Paenibacillus agricola TaxID=2716264 RepID=A0ABX0J5Q5_9BACL|nr:hypothetical protein [Paenibacillus agricola]NHN31131.1 hypothetical protein [Paenibacillus agricola]